MNQHRWSGWPGAWCLDCGCDDPGEIALADNKWDLDAKGNIVFDPPLVCPPCPEPGSKRHDPYATKGGSSLSKRFMSEFGQSFVRMTSERIRWSRNDRKA